MSEGLPAPLTPPDCDLRSFVYMPVDIIRLFSSEFHAKANDSEWRAGFTLWLKSYHQVPAGSIPDDDVMLARMAELGRDVDAWVKLRPMALHGWVKCSDGRLYHPTVCEKAAEAWEQKRSNKERGRSGAEKRWRGHSPAMAEASPKHGSATQEPMLADSKERRGEELKGEEQQPRARGPSPEDNQVRMVIEAFDQAIADAFGPERRRPFPAGSDAVYARRWVKAGLTLPDLYEFFAVRQRSRKDKGREPIGSLAFFDQAVAELVSAPAAAPSATAQVRFLSPAAEIRARLDWFQRELAAAKAAGRPPPDVRSCGICVDHGAQEFRLMEGSRPPIPPSQDREAAG